MSSTTLSRDNMLRLARDEKFRANCAQKSIDAMPEGFDWSARGAVPAAAMAAFGWNKDSCPVQKVAKKETTEGTALRVLADAIRAILKGDKSPEAGVIRIGLSGEGGGTITLRKGDANYAAALKFYGTLSK